MLFRADCRWCGDRVRSFRPARRRDFLDEHEETCGASGNLHWVVDLRAPGACVTAPEQAAPAGAALPAQRDVDLRETAPAVESD